MVRYACLPWRKTSTVAKDVHQAVREICLCLPESEEFPSHGSPNFRVRGKTFATYVINHHGDGRVALWLNAPAGAQEHFTGSEPKYFFVPPYVGPRGWLGMHLNKGLSWKRVAGLVRQSYEKVAPRPLANSIGATVEIKPPTRKLTASEIDPLQAPRARTILKGLSKICLSWPETAIGEQFGFPGWRAGQKLFVYLRSSRDWGGPRGGGSGRPKLQAHFWVGVAAQGLMTADQRFEIPPYMGHNGWIALDVTKSCDWDEVRGLAFASYRHFALKRMLAAVSTEEV
jgi:predicted DNA-binding protein (MmcQ/YjbR family)